MTWYTAICGNWSRPETVKRLPGTFSRKDIFAAAQDLANSANCPVTIYADKGIRTICYNVNPEKWEVN